MKEKKQIGIQQTFQGSAPSYDVVQRHELDSFLLLILTDGGRKKEFSITSSNCQIFNHFHFQIQKFKPIKFPSFFNICNPTLHNYAQSFHRPEPKHSKVQCSFYKKKNSQKLLYFSIFVLYSTFLFCIRQLLI